MSLRFLEHDVEGDRDRWIVDIIGSHISSIQRLTYTISDTVRKDKRY